MKITAIISEYNPMHNGHIYQLNKAKEETKPDLTIAIMSGNFVQRGEISVLPKDVKAKIAIENGFDMVIELPTIFAVNNAECFSYGAINLIKNIPNITLSFGSESGNISDLTIAANITKSENYQQLVKKYLDQNNSYPVSTNLAIKEFLGSDILSYSNNILAVEYIKNVEKINKNINLHTVKRVNNYNYNNIENNFVSSTYIRNLKNKEDAKTYMPINSYNELVKFEPKYNNFNNFALSKLFDIKSEELNNIFDVNEGLENRIKSTINNTSSYEEFIEKLQTKRYSKSKLNRIVINALLSITNESMKKAKNTNYISVLAIKKNKIDILGYLNNYTKIITKYTDTKLLNDDEKLVYNIDKKANKLYELINNIKVKNNMIIVD